MHHHLGEYGFFPEDNFKEPHICRYVTVLFLILSDAFYSSAEYISKAGKIRIFFPPLP